jgi:hypothetical protein
MTRRFAAILAVLALTVGLVGAGISASYSDSATAIQNIAVGTFGCDIDTDVEGAVVINDNDVSSVTFTAPEIQSSAASSIAFPFTVNSFGSIPLTVQVTMTTPVAPFTSTLVAPADVYLNQNESHLYAGGLQWPMLVNADLNKTATITYTATCNEGLPQAAVGTPTAADAPCGSPTGTITIPSSVHVQYSVDGSPASAGSHAYAPGTYLVTAVAEPGFQLLGYPPGGWTLVIGTDPCIEFIGVAGAATGGVNAVALPAGWQPGDIAIAMSVRWASLLGPTVPAGWTTLDGLVTSNTTPDTSDQSSRIAYRILQAGDTTTGVWANAHDTTVVVYRNVGSVGAISSASAVGTSPLTLPGLTLQVANGSSWVAGMASFSGGSFTISGVTVRRAGSIAVADTNAGVSSWASHSAVTGGLSGGKTGYSFELKVP